MGGVGKRRNKIAPIRRYLPGPPNTSGDNNRFIQRVRWHERFLIYVIERSIEVLEEADTDQGWAQVRGRSTYAVGPR